MWAKAKRKSKHKRAHLTPLPPPLDILTHLTMTSDCVIRLLMGPGLRQVVTIYSVALTEQCFSAYHQYIGLLYDKGRNKFRGRVSVIPRGL